MNNQIKNKVFKKRFRTAVPKEPVPPVINNTDHFKEIRIFFKR